MRECVQADGEELPRPPVPEHATRPEDAQAAHDQAKVPQPANEAYYPLGSGGFHILNNTLNGNTYPKHNEVKIPQNSTFNHAEFEYNTVSDNCKFE